MEKSDKKYPYFDEDFLFFLLNLVDYPDRSKKTLDFAEFKKIKFKDADKQKIFNWILDLTKEHRLKPVNFTFSGKVPWEPNTLEKLLAYLEERAINGNEENIGVLNFQMNIEKMVREKIYRKIERYITDFIEGKLEFDEELYPSFSFHKEKILGFLEKYLDKAGKVLRLKSSDFANDFRFIEAVLALEAQKYFGLQSLVFEEGYFLAKIITMEKLISVNKNSESKENRKTKKLKIIKLPAGKTWDDMTIKFVNKFDLQIFIDDKLFDTLNNEELGCFKQNSKDDQGDAQWQLLIEIALNSGILDLNGKNAKEKEKIKQQKRKLSERLRMSFNLKANPFRHDPQAGIFRTSFKLLPHSSLHKKYIW